MKQIPLALAPVSDASFDNFTPGPNGAALAHLAGLVAELEALGRRACQPAPLPPVYLWGEPGCGKTHLLRALAARSQALGRKLGSFGAAVALPWELSPDWALIAIDDFHALSDEAQAAAFSLFVHAAEHGLPVVAAGRVPPVDLGVREDLRTRLAWGHVFALKSPSEADTRAALRCQADERGIVLSDELLDHLLTRFPRDLGPLLALLERIDTFSLSRSRKVTVPLLREMLADSRDGSEAAAALLADGGR